MNYTKGVNATKSTTVFSDLPSLSSDDARSDSENKKLSFWLEKLHIQGEKTRIDDNRREKQTAIDQKKVLRNDQLPVGNVIEQTQSGIDSQTRDMAAKTEADSQMVNDLVKKSNRCIISISSSYPWNFFRSTIDVEESRVTFIFRQFLSNQSHSVDIKDISNVFIESSIFSSTLQVVSRTFIQNDIKIGNLNKAKAQKVKRIIEGLRTFEKHNINTSNYEIAELTSKIEEFHTDDKVL
jgi:hypothetical protein